MARGKCLSCGGKVPMYANICPHCGKALTWSGPGVKAIKATCPQCGRYTTSVSRTCVHCGAPIDWSVTSQNQKAVSVQKWSLIGQGLGQLGCAIMLLVFVVIPMCVLLYACATSH